MTCHRTLYPSSLPDVHRVLVMVVSLFSLDGCDSNIRCSGDGYVDKNCMCVCPEGGNSCQIYPDIPPIPTITCE